MRIGYIGLGSMGGDQARLLARSWNNFTVFDVSPQALKAFEGKAKLAASVAAVGQDAEYVSVCVRDDQQVRGTLEGDRGLLSSMSEGSVILIHSTIRPETVIDLAGKAAARGITVIDAPVTRTVMQGDGRFVFTMTGGDEEVTERVRPLIGTFSTEIIHVGKLGSAMVLKISNNLVTWVELAIALQAFQLANAGGVASEKLITVMKRNGNLSSAMEALVRGSFGVTAPDQRKAFMESQGRIGEKDLDLAIGLAAAFGVEVPTAAQVREIVLKSMISA